MSYALKLETGLPLVGDVISTGTQLIRALEEVIQFGGYIVKYYNHYRQQEW